MDVDCPLPQSLFDFVAGLARSATIEQLQARYLDGVGTFLPSSAAGLYLLDPFTRRSDAVAARGVSDFFLSRYEECGRQRDPVLAQSVLRDDAVHSGQLMDGERWKRQSVYGEVFALHRMTALLEAPLTSDGETVGTLNFGRFGSGSAFTEPQRQMAGVVARLTALALDAVRRRDRDRRARDSVVAALDLCGEALFITDLVTAERRVNAPARRLLERLADENASIDDLTLDAVPPRRTIRQEVPVVLRDGSAARLRLRSTTAAEDPAVVVTFVTLVEASAASCRVTEDYGFTPREQEVAELAAAGLRDSEIADRLFLSSHTVKHYLKTVYSKAGVRSRVELAGLGREASKSSD